MDLQRAVTVLLDAADDGRLAALCERHGVDIMTLFGSAATDPASAADVDVAVRFRRGLAGDQVPLVNELLDLLSTDAVDLMVLNGASPTARFAGLVEARPLYESADGVWATAQMAAAIEFYETDWLRRIDLDALAR